MHTRIVGALALVAVLVTSAFAQDNKNPPKPDDKSPAEQVAAITQEYQKKNNEWMTKARAEFQNASEEERAALMAARPQPGEYAGPLMEIAKKYPTDPAAVEALVWVVTNAGGPNATEAVKVLTEKHYKNERISDIFQSLMRSPSKATEELFQTVMKENPNQKAQGQACYALAGYLKQLKEYNEMLNGERAALIRQSIGEEAANYVAERASSDMLDSEIEKLLERTVTEFGDVAMGNKTLKEMAERELFEIRHLAIGMVAPEIEGEDVEGENFKLSDYRGKVVMLDFWGDW